jgi:G patch domain-containing protein 1
MTPEARERIVKATGRMDLPPALGEKAPKGFEISESQKRKDLWDLVPKLDKDAAMQALSRGVSGWMPYAEDESKGSRYRAFLEVRAGLSDRLPERAAGATTGDWATELQEFARAAQVFKPISGMMASRFTSSTSQPRVASDTSDASSNEPLLKHRQAKPEDPAEAAAKIGMYGPMTRSTLSFYPTRLLCKRFNVKPPSHVQTDPGDFPGYSESGSGAGSRFQSAGYQANTNSKLDLVSKDVVNQLMIESGGGIRLAPSPGPDTEQATPPPAAKEVVVDADRNEALEAGRPGAAVFKAIFGSDDEDDEEDD